METNNQQYSDLQHEARSLLKSRADTLALYQQVMSCQPFEDSPYLHELLEDFCEQLVDYSGKVHFTILNHIQDHYAGQTELVNTANETSVKLVQNTQKILDFQDAYSCDAIDAEVSLLTDRLNQLGEIIADRIAIEDQLLNLLG